MTVNVDRVLRALTIVQIVLCACVAVAYYDSTVTAQRRHRVDPLPLPAVVHPVLFTQAPDPAHEGHKMRPDGQSCKATGKEACACTVNSCQRDDQGKVTSWHPSSSCQWFCRTDKCDCHACVEGECPDGAVVH